MKRSLIIAGLTAGMLCVLSQAVAKQKKAKPGPLAGTWDCISHGGPEGDLPFTLHLQQDKGNVTGSVESPIGGTQLSSAVFQKKTLEIRIDTPQAKYILTGKIKKNRLTGEWSVDTGQKGTWEGTKIFETNR